MKKRKDGRYQTSVYIGVVDGKKKNTLVYGRTQKECRQKANELKRKIDKGIDYASEKTSWQTWVNNWGISQKPILKPQMLTTYKSYLKHFDSLNNIPLNKLQISDFQHIINQLSIKNPTTHKPTAHKSLKEYRAIANRIFEYAIENRATDFNPVKYVKLPQGSPKNYRRSLTPEEKGWIENYPHRAQLPAMIMLYSGLRLAECLALQWIDIDFKKNQINVNKTLMMKEKPPRTKPGTKTGPGRIVDIPEKLIEFLRPLRKSPFDYIITNTKGNLMSASNWRHLWDSYMFNLNFKYGDFSRYIKKPKNKYQPKEIPMVIDRFTAHYLRHTNATALRDAGCDILYVKEQLGHSDIKVTLGIYTHLTEKNKTKNKLIMDLAFSDNKDIHKSVS